MLIEKGLSVYRYQRIVSGGIVFLSLFVGSLAFCAYVSLWKTDMGWDRWMLSMAKVKGKLWDLPRIEERKFEILLPDLSDRLVVLEHTPRLDMEKKEGSLLLGIEGCGQKRMVREGEKVFLNCLNEKEITFSSEPTPFWVDPAVGVLHVEYLNGNQEVIYSGERPFRLARVESFGDGGEILPVIAYLNKVKIFEPDRVIELYGGELFKCVKSAYRMLCGKETIFIKAGDQFAWRGERLEVGKGDTKGVPLVWIRSIDSQKCEMVVWDSEGLYGKPVIVAVGKGTALSGKPQESFLKLHLRSETSVTCQLNQHQAIVRQGDWFLYSKGNVRKLRTSDEVKEFLKYALKGELFIFDGIVKRENGPMFVGHLFNEERTQVKKIEIPLSERKKKKE